MYLGVVIGINELEGSEAANMVEMLPQKLITISHYNSTARWHLKEGIRM